VVFWQQIVTHSWCVFNCEFAQFLVGRWAAVWNEICGDGILNLDVARVWTILSNAEHSRTDFRICEIGIVDVFDVEQ